MLQIITLYALFALIFTFSKLGISTAAPIFFVGSRMSLASLILLSYYFFWQKKKLRLNFGAGQDYLLFGLMACYLCNVSEIWATRYLPSSKVCLLYSLSPFISALIAYFSLKETLNTKKLLGLCIGFIGLLPISMTQSFEETKTGLLFFLSYPEWAMIVAVVSSAYGWILLKRLVVKHQQASILVTGIGMGLGGFLSLMNSVFAGEVWNPLPIQNYKLFIPISILICFISNVLCYNLYARLLKRFSASLMSFSGLMTPIFTSLFGWLFLKEHISWHYFFAMLLFSVGLTIFYRSEKAQVFKKS